MIFSIIYVLIERGILGDSPIYPSTGVTYRFKWNFILTAIGSSLFGLIIGSIETLFLSSHFKSTSFSIKVIIKTAIYIVAMISFLLLISIANNLIDSELELTDEALWVNIRSFFFNWAFWSIEIYITCLIIITLLYAEFRDYLGREVVRNFFTGKYHKPIEEERIFMFLDMRSSTTIAEKLGHIRYFEMLRSYYNDLSDPIVKTDGYIYQYVGDEIVVSWKIDNQTTVDDCISCFEMMKKHFKLRADYYQKEYGLIPTFKAGFHTGKVTTGEIGKFKKDITFTGDVLNTAARIQALCNSFNVDLLLSKAVINKLSETVKKDFISIGEIELKGKNKKVELYKFA